VVDRYFSATAAVCASQQLNAEEAREYTVSETHNCHGSNAPIIHDTTAYLQHVVATRVWALCAAMWSWQRCMKPQLCAASARHGTSSSLRHQQAHHQ
jgi:hypothetical protein